MAEPDRKAQLLEDLRWALAPHTELRASADAALAAVLPHIEAAYKRGLIAGRSQAGYTTRRKKKEETCPATSPSARSATESAASAGEP